MLLQRYVQMYGQVSDFVITTTPGTAGYITIVISVLSYALTHIRYIIANMGTKPYAIQWEVKPLDVMIRNLDDASGKKIESLARAKGVSREEYLRQLIQTHAMTSMLSPTEDKYTQLVQMVLLALSENTENFKTMQTAFTSLQDMFAETRRDNSV